jgi:hypothetical protein
VTVGGYRSAGRQVGNAAGGDVLPAVSGDQPCLHAGDPEGVDGVGVLLQAHPVWMPGAGGLDGCGDRGDRWTLR